VNPLRHLGLVFEPDALRPLSSVFHRLSSVVRDESLFTVPANMLASEALRLMKQKDFSQVPIREGGEIVGVFSYRSFAVHSVEFTDPETRSLGLTVADFAEDLPFVRPSDPFDEVIEKLEHYDAVLLGTPENTVGIVTAMDILRYLYDATSPYVLVAEIELAVRALMSRSLGDSFDSQELEIFRSALDGKDRGLRLSELHPSDQFKGCRAVIRRRIHSPDIADWHRGIDLFNGVMESALPTDDSLTPRCYILLQTAREFAPGFIERLLRSARAHEEERLLEAYRAALKRNRFEDLVLRGLREVWEGSEQNSTVQTPAHDRGLALESIRPLLVTAAHMVGQNDWPQSDLALGKFLLIFDYYEQLTRDDE
jgi:CBS domain-containing protein